MANDSRSSTPDASKLASAAPVASKPGRSGSLPILDQQQPASATLSASDAAFLETPREISTQEFLTALTEDRREDVAKMIVQDDRLVRSRDISGASAIQLAVYRGQDEMLGILLRSEVELDLYEAAVVGDSERLQTLLATAEGRQAIDSTSEDGFPPLSLAAFCGRTDAVDALLDAGADPNRPAENPTRLRPLHAAAAHQGTPNGDAAVGRALVAKLLAAGGDPEAEQAGGFRPLHAAAAAGEEALVDLLLDADVQVDPPTDLGLTPAELAAERGHTALAARLSKALPTASS